MANKTVMISGANGNLGSAVSTHFLNQGDKVLGLVHRSKEGEEYPENYFESRVNLLDEKEAQHTVAVSINRHTNIDYAVLTAGGFAAGGIASTTTADLENYFRLNFETAYNLVKPLFLHMKENKKGKIFLIGSGTGMNTSKGKSTVAYSLSKSLLFQLANILNVEMEETGVQAHVVVPGTIDTPQNRTSMPDADFSKWQKPEAIAEIIANYAEKENDLEKTVLVIAEEL